MNEDQHKLKCILNLACVVMARQVTPAQRERAERLLVELREPEAEKPEDEWTKDARAACPNWREL